MPSKSAWLRIAGDQAFNTYSLVLVSVIATIGTLSLYVGNNPTKLLEIFAILGMSQLGALAPIFIIAPLAKRIQSNANRIAVVIAAFILVNVIRSILLDLLLVKWGLESESKLAFRLYSNVVFLTILYLVLAWFSDFIFENFSELSVKRSELDELIKKFYALAQEISEARTFGSRELMLEVGAITSALESVPIKIAAESQTQKFMDQLNAVTKSVVLKLRKLERAFPNRTSTPQISTQVKLSAARVLSAGTYSTPYAPRLMGSLSFVALSGWLSYFIDRETALQWASYLGIYGYIVYSLFAKFLVPTMRRRKPVTRFVIYELSLVPFIFFWLALLGYYAGDDSTTYGIAATNSISVFIYANLATFTSGALVAVRENREVFEGSVSKLRAEVDVLVEIKKSEELIWQELLGAETAKSPTTATVQFRDAIARLNKDAIEELLPSVLAIWYNVDNLLEL